MPPNFVPSSVTWDSATTGWVIGQAGTPGSCANSDPYICTSVARTDDTGERWTGLHAPDTGAAQGTTGVSGLRFLNGTDGWAFGPQLWSTHDGGVSWTQVNTGGRLVTDVETVGDQAYALFATCSGPSAWAAIDHSCSSFTLETTVASADDWTPVSGVPASLAVNTVDGGEGVLALTDMTGYLIAPDGTLYSGPVNAAAWHPVRAIPCLPGNVYLNNSLAHPVELAPAGYTASGGTRLALVCAAMETGRGDATIAYISDDGGATWTPQSQVGTRGTAFIGAPASVTANPSGTIILATSTGIWTLPLNASAWQAATLSDSSGKSYGFSYVGMTTALQGVALGGDPALHAIWMTTDGGQSWSVVPVSGG